MVVQGGGEHEDGDPVLHFVPPPTMERIARGSPLVGAKPSRARPIHRRKITMAVADQLPSGQLPHAGGIDKITAMFPRTKNIDYRRRQRTQRLPLVVRSDQRPEPALVGVGWMTGPLQGSSERREKTPVIAVWIFSIRRHSNANCSRVAVQLGLPAHLGQYPARFIAGVDSDCYRPGVAASRQAQDFMDCQPGAAKDLVEGPHRVGVVEDEPEHIEIFAFGCSADLHLLLL